MLAISFIQKQYFIKEDSRFRLPIMSYISINSSFSLHSVTQDVEFVISINLGSSIAL